MPHGRELVVLRLVFSLECQYRFGFLVEAIPALEHIPIREPSRQQEVAGMVPLDRVVKFHGHFLYCSRHALQHRLDR
jgi:hypothetical protein